VGLRQNHYFLIAVIALALVFLVNSLTFPEVRMKIMPVFASSLVIVLSSIQLAKEVIARRRKTPKTGPKAEEGLRKNILTFVWFAGIVVAIYLAGFLISIPLFVVLYLRLQGKNWFISAISAVSTIVVLYLVFIVALQVELYPGLLFGGH
jgi:hypothetical protein